MPEVTVVNSWVCTSPSALAPPISHKQKTEWGSPRNKKEICLCVWWWQLQS